MSWARADLQGRPAWLLEMTIEGHVYRYSDRELTVTDAAGNDYLYSEGLDDISVSPSALATPDAAITVTVHDSTDWAALEAQGVIIEGQPALLRRWFPGMVLEEARIMLEGQLGAPVYETINDPLEIAIIRRMPGRSWSILDDADVVDEQTYPDIPATGTYTRDEALDGAYIPVVIGIPGDVPASFAATNLPASPALLTKLSTNGADTDDRMTIGMGRLQCSDQVNGVRIWDVTDRPAVSGLFDTITVTNGIGVTTTEAKIGGGTVGGTAIDFGRQYWAAFRRTSSGAFGGQVDPRTGNLLRGAGSTMLWLHETFGNDRIDVARMRATAEQLDGILIDAVINAGDIDPTRWIAANLLPILPIEPVWGVQGLWYRLWNWTATAVDAIAHFNCDPDGNAVMTGPVKPSEFEVFNRFVLAYRYVPDKGRFKSRTFLRGDPDPNDSRKSGSLICKRSEATHGILRAPRIQSAVLWDEGSAKECLALKAAKHGWRKRILTLQLGNEWEYLEEGDVITVQRTASSIINAPALITAQLIGSPNSVAFEVHLIDHPVHTIHIP